MPKPSQNTTLRLESGNDPLIKEMEKFMSEGSTITRPLRSNTKKVLDIKKLCNILEDKDTSLKNQKNSEKAVNQAKRRKLDNNNITTKKDEKNTEKPKIDPKNKDKTKKSTENKSKCNPCVTLSKNVKIVVDKASKRSKTPTNTTNKPQKQKTKNGSSSITEKRLKSHTVTSRNKAEGKNNNNILHAVLHFAKHRVLADQIYKKCKLLPPLRQRLNAKLKRVENYLHTPIIYKPDIRYQSIPIIDLTKGDDEEDMKIISEKECANKILTFIHEFSNYYPAKRAIEEVADILNTEDDCLNTFFSNGTHLGLDLIKELRYSRIRNFELTRFLNFVVFKLEQIFKVMVPPVGVALYLHLMLRLNQKSLENKLLESLFVESTKMLQMEVVKKEIRTEENKYVVPDE